MKLDKRAYGIVYRMRKKGLWINTRSRTVNYDYDKLFFMEKKPVKRLVKEYGFTGQATIV
jgi:hypothetical protein